MLTTAHAGGSRSRPAALSLANVLLVGLMNLPLLRALALPFAVSVSVTDDEEGKDPQDAGLWLYLGIALALVLLGGLFAGLTIAYVLSFPFLRLDVLFAY